MEEKLQSNQPSRNLVYRVLGKKSCANQLSRFWQHRKQPSRTPQEMSA
jgi:hypothetical protein